MRTTARTHGLSFPTLLFGLGVLAAGAAVLLLVLNRMGLIGSVADVPSGTPSVAPPVTPPVTISAKGAAGAAKGLIAGAGVAPALPAPERLPSIELALPRVITLGKGDGASYTITAAMIEPRNAESFALVLLVRMRNSGSYPVNFWDASFRLLAPAGAIAASGGLNELVESRSESPAGRVVFVVPRGSAPHALRVEFAGESTELALRLI